VADSPLAATVAKGLLGPPVIDEVAILAPGFAVSLQIIRNGQPTNVTLRLAHWSSAADALAKLGPTAM